MTEEPKLDKPGAGVPWAEKMVMRFYIKPFVARRATWEQSTESFNAITKKIEDVIAGLTDEQMNKKILVPPQRALEDSSRYWSVAMVLEHLVIVGMGISTVIRRLSSGKAMAGVSDTATVKPMGHKTAEQARAEFQKFCHEFFPQVLTTVMDRESPLTFRHAWFGPMTAREWYWLLGAHQAIHLKQIREICQRLG